ncbi:MAG: sigma-70 family RNA polymerase sigma factor [Candidatus Hydrogenedentes bacterium]|nr:sigma-70 family RNA polymerase sigma factor [Candidatus Hydrogenedentota bacterium]
MQTNDATLWELWKTRHDADAFMELVLRHSGMVYATCKRVLGNAADAEDATQECFVELLDARVRVDGSLAPWLHTVAFRRSLDKAKSERRRSEREARYAEAANVPVEPSPDDVLAEVDEAIAALPDPIRFAVIQRFLEGKTHNEIAGILGVSESTVRYRIDQGVGRIRETLQKRGIAVGVVALASILEGESATAAPAGLTAAVAKLALARPGVASVGGTAISGWLAAKVGFGVASLIAIVGAIAYLGGGDGYTPPGRVADESRIEEKSVDIDTATPPLNHAHTSQSPSAPPSVAVPATQEETPQDATLSGFVIDEGGYPIIGANVALITWASGYDYRGIRAWLTETDDAGHYSFTGFKHSPPYDRLVFADVSASAPGYATVGKRVSIRYGETLDDVAFTLSPGATVQGRVLTPGGAPVASAVVNCRSANTSSLPYLFTATDEDGRFVLGIDKPGSAGFVVSAEDDKETLFHSVPVGMDEEISLTMQQPASLAGRLTWSDGAPAADLHLSLTCRYPMPGETPDYAKQVQSQNAFEIGMGYIHSAKSGGDGRFSFESFAPGPDFVLDAWRRVGDPDDPTSEKVGTFHLGPVAPGQSISWDGVIPMDVDLMRITGVVRGRQFGKPLDTVLVANERIDGGSHSWASPDPVTGRYDISIADPGTYLIWPRYNGVDEGTEKAALGQKVTWAAGETLELDFELPDPFALSARVVDVEGNPITDADVNYDPSSVPGALDEEGRCGWHGFAPYHDARIVVEKEGYLRTETETIAGEPGVVYPEETLVLYQSGGIEGTVVYPDGTPAANTRVAVTFESEDFSTRTYGQQTNRVFISGTTDGDGHFAFAHGFPAVAGEMSVAVYSTNTRQYHSDAAPAEVYPTSIIDIGTLTLRVTSQEEDAR